jgi:hypothetical protein
MCRYPPSRQPGVSLPSVAKARTPDRRCGGRVAAVVLAALALNLALRALDAPVAATAVTFLVMAGLLTYAFIKSARGDTRPAKSWGESWRRRHLLMFALSLLIAFSALLIPDADESAWILVPLVLAVVPLMFTPLATLGRASGARSDRG